MHLGTISLGFTAGKRGMTGQDNTLLGVGSGSSMTSGDNNTFVGSTSGNANTDGYDNTFVGYQSGKIKYVLVEEISRLEKIHENNEWAFDNTAIGSNVQVYAVNNW